MQEGKLLLNSSSNWNCLFIDWYTEIERENRILLEKMTTIMNNKNGN